MEEKVLSLDSLLWTGVKSAGPWCYVQKDTCKHQPIADNSGLFYDNCATINSTHTVDTCKASMKLQEAVLSWQSIQKSHLCAF